MVRISKKSISKSGKNKSIKKTSDKLNRIYKNEFFKFSLFSFKNLIIFILFIFSVFCYHKLYVMNQKIDYLNLGYNKLQDIQKRIDEKNDFDASLIEKITNIDNKYRDEISVLRDKINIVDNNQKLKAGPHLVALTIVNHLKLRIDMGENFESTLEALKSLNLSDKNIIEFIEFASLHTNGVKTLNSLQNTYENLLMNAVVAQKNFDRFGNYFPSFLNKMIYSFINLIKIRKIVDTDNDTRVDFVLQKISIELNNGNLKNTVNLLNILRDKYSEAFNVLKIFYDDVSLKYRLDSDLSKIIASLLKNIYSMQKLNN